MKTNETVILQGLVVALLIAALYLFFLSRRYSIQSSLLRKMLPIMVAATASVLSLLQVFKGFDDKIFISKNDIVSDRIAQLQGETDLLTSKIVRLDSLILKIRSQSPGQSSNQEVLQQVAILRQEVTLTRSDVKKFGDLLLSDAERLITLPLLKKEIESIDSEIRFLKEQITIQSILVKETQEQGRWIIGTLGVGILALIIPVIRSVGGQTKDQKDEKKE